MSILTLSMTSVLILVALSISKIQKLKMEKEILIGVFRAVIQLSAIGMVLKYIFQMGNFLLTTLMLLIMVANASYIVGKRGLQVKNIRSIAFFSILIGAGVTITILILTGAISYQPSEAIPVSGMIIGNAMVALGLTFKQLHNNYRNRYQEVEIKLALGATERSASGDLVRDAIRTGMQPTVDSMQTLGIVQLPGMMTGLILAGQSPIMAIRYQIMVTFMLLSTVSIATLIGAFILNKRYYSQQKQLNKLIL